MTACQNKPTNYPLRQSRNPTVCHAVGITEFVLKKLNHEESAGNTNAKILPLNYLTTVLFLLADINNISFITMPMQIQKNTTISNNFDPVICTRDVGPDLELNSLQSEQRDGTSRWL